MGEVRSGFRESRHRERVQLKARACAAARGRHIRGTCVSGECAPQGGECAPQGAPCKMPGGQWVRCARRGHAATAEEHAVLCAVLPCCSDSLAATTTEAGWQALGVPPHSTAQAAACRFVKESGAGVAGAGCDGTARVADAVSAAHPSGKCGGGAGPWAAHPRGDRHCRPQLRYLLFTYNTTRTYVRTSHRTTRPIGAFYAARV